MSKEIIVHAAMLGTIIASGVIQIAAGLHVESLPRSIASVLMGTAFIVAAVIKLTSIRVEQTK